MSIATLKGQNVDVRLWTPIEQVEYEALTQLKNIAALPWVFHHVASMPDVHYGKGATVGSVIAMKGAVSPAAVGVDIGCGMGAIKTNLRAEDLPTSLKLIREEIEKRIPVGFQQHDDQIKLREMGVEGQRLINDFNKLFDRFPDLDGRVQNLDKKAKLQCGTLGGGNHFIELCLDTHGYVWMMLHSGSRNIGKTLAEIHMSIAAGLAHNASLPDPDLSVFLAGTQSMQNYRRDLFWAQEYAFLNRRFMFELDKQIMLKFFPQVKFEQPILCHHNYVAEERHFGEDVLVTRKGAINAEKDRLGIIPGSMGAKSFIVRGLGNEESFNSASHGAGRKLSRNKAKKHFSVKDLEEQTKGVECRKDEGVLDEIPGAYKDIDQVMENQRDLVEVVAQLKGILCVKG
jgi:tRNA-splicing ligase RtcB (3'-phosphate/5'-hydroxy nucleic acid ligase)